MSVFLKPRWKSIIAYRRKLLKRNVLIHDPVVVGSEWPTFTSGACSDDDPGKKHGIVPPLPLSHIRSVAFFVVGSYLALTTRYVKMSNGEYPTRWNTTPTVPTDVLPPVTLIDVSAPEPSLMISALVPARLNCMSQP